MKTKKTLAELYSFPGFRASSRLTGVLGDPVARVITLTRRQKKQSVRSVASGTEFSTTGDAIGRAAARHIRLAVMDMWSPFRGSTMLHAPQTEIVYDKFHILRHLADTLDTVRRSEYRRVSEREQRFIKGQRYTLLSNRANLELEGKRALALLLKANRRLHKAYLLKESFGQLWSYRNPIWARKFFDRWQEQLRWSRLEPFRKFAALIERHWDGIVSYCRPEHKVSLGFMEGLNTKIRLIQRRAYGIKDPGYLRLKVLTSFIPDA